MDKVKDICFAVFVKHLFWTLGFVILVMGVVAWWMSTGELQEEYSTNKGKIEQTHTTISNVLNKPTEQIFNNKTHEGMAAENNRRAKEVYLAWREKYSRQQEEVLVWPEGLSDAFVRDVENILGGKPIEEVQITTKNDLITTRREEFRDEINILLPRLAEMINARWDPTASTEGRRGRGGRRAAPMFGGQFEGRQQRRTSGDSSEEEEEEAPVDWYSSDQGNIQARHFDFVETPSTIEILYAMEDYWVLKALMQIVARTNTDESGQLADARHKAVIREIHSIDIGGNWVESNAGQVYRLVPTEGEATEAEMAPGRAPIRPGAVPGEMPEGGEAGAYGSPSIAQVDELAEGRYVDKFQQPIPAATLKSAATGKNEDEAYLAVAKRMPVRMRVKMDQRKINKFLVECGNGDLMLEVLQVRVNPDEPTLAGSSPGGNGGNRGYGGSRANRSPVVGRSSSSESGNSQSAEYPWDVVVEVYGIIYIFNPPSIERLGLTEEDKQKLDAVDLRDAEAVEAAAAEPSAGEPPSTDEDTGDDAGADDAADDGDAADGEAAPADVAPDEAADADEPPDAGAEEAARAKPPAREPAVGAAG